MVSAFPTSAFCLDVVPGTFILRIRISTRSVVPAEREAAHVRDNIQLDSDFLELERSRAILTCPGGSGRF